MFAGGDSVRSTGTGTGRDDGSPLPRSSPTATATATSRPFAAPFAAFQFQSLHEAHRLEIHQPCCVLSVPLPNSSVFEACAHPPTTQRQHICELKHHVMYLTSMHLTISITNAANIYRLDQAFIQEFIEVSLSDFL
uniref:Uncharacterized protein n=1 Tax=Oryza rufipogon TaxID=4529 RepID=A0A0E0Q5U5_ORYRU